MGRRGRISDELWNAVGRPANDPAFALLFPGGYGYYAGGELETQPHRVELLATLAGLGNPSGWLVIFDRRTGAPPVQERTSVATAATPSGRQVAVIRA